MHVNHHHFQAFHTAQFFFVRFFNARLSDVITLLVVVFVVFVLIQFGLANFANVTQGVGSDGERIVAHRSGLEIKTWIAPKHLGDVGVVFLRHLGHKRRRLQEGFLFCLVHPFNKRSLVNIQQVAETDCVERIIRIECVLDDGLLGNHHEVVYSFVEHQQLAVAVIDLATGRVLRHETEGVVVGHGFVLVVDDLEKKQLHDIDHPHGNEDAHNQ